MLKLVGCVALIALGYFGRDLVHYSPATNTATVTVPKLPAAPSLPKVAVR